MDARHWVALALLGAVVACQPAPPPPATQPAAPADAEVLRSVRESYQAVDPNTRVGLVTAVAPDVSLVAVGDIDLQGFREGDYLTIIDSQRNVVANGRVAVVTGTALHVRYDGATATRTPRQGDLAVAATLPR